MKTATFLKSIATSMCLLLCAEAAIAGARPIYAIVHRVNDLNDITDAIEHGANAIELDLQLCRDNTTWEVNHDNCGGSTTVDKWLDTFKKADDHTNIALVIFDIKESASNVGEEDMTGLVDSARSKLGPEVIIVYGVGDWDNRGNLEHIMDDLNSNEAVTIDYSSGTTAKQKIDFFADKDIHNQVYADGITAHLSTPSSVWANLKTGYNEKGGKVRFNYSWTYERESSIEKVLIDYKMDGVMVNDCAVYCADYVGDDGLDNVLDVLEDFDDEIRLATRADRGNWGLK